MPEKKEKQLESVESARWVERWKSGQNVKKCKVTLDKSLLHVRLRVKQKLFHFLPGDCEWYVC